MGPPKPTWDEDEERARTLSEQISLTGSTGLLRTAYAGSSAAGMFRLGATFDWFSTSGFLCNTESRCAGGTAEDSTSHVGANFALNATPLSFLEAYASIKTYANSNDKNSPGLLQVLGDTTFGVKAFTPFRIANFLTLGADFRLMLLNGAGDVGVAGSGTSAEFNALASADFRKIRGKGAGAPVRVHFNTGYRIDNSGELVLEVEEERARRNPSVAGGLSRIPINRVERFGLGINRTDFFQLRLGVDVPLSVVQPYIEYSVDVPVNRQGYECHTRTIAPGDTCLALTDLTNPNSGGIGYDAIPSHVSFGARATPFKGAFRGLSGHLGFDIGVSGTSTFIEEVAPTAPWTLYLGLGFAFDTQKKKPETIVRTIALPPPPLPPPPAHYYVRGKIVDKASREALSGAMLTVAELSNPPTATGADGGFLSRELVPGTYTINISHPDYNPGTCSVTVNAANGGPPPLQPGMQPPPLGAPVAPPVSGPVYTDVECEVDALPRRGNISGLAKGTDGSNVANANIELTDSEGKKHTAITDNSGSFDFKDLPAGKVSLKASAEKYMLHVSEDLVKSRETRNVNLSLNKRPKTKNVRVIGNQIRVVRKIHFETDSAKIKGDSQTLMEEIADVLDRNPNLMRVEIQGHTDNTGSRARNKELSQQRADAVRSWLVSHGINPGRMSAKGYGSSRPIAPNITAANRSRNRRVQFVILEKAK